ncbi:MAG: HEAT repeat domain-containing protein, partial [Candidatus Acidiferrales bacterium]
AMALLGLVYAQTDQNAAEVLFEDLRGSDEEARKTAEEKLTLLALEDLENVLPSLQKGLKDPSPEVRFYCAVVLAVAAYDDEKNAIMLSEAAPSLTGALKDDDARVREAAAGALGLVRPSPPSEAVSALVGVLGDREPKVRKAALEALTSVQPIDVELVFAILHAHEDDPSEEVRAEAAKTLARMSANDPDVVWSLTKSLKSSDHFLRQESIRALGKLGPAAAPAIPELEKIAENPTEDRTVRKYASQALRKIKGQ